jgi:hypothetical protein
MTHPILIAQSSIIGGGSQQFAIFLKSENLFSELIIDLFWLPGSTTASFSHRALAGTPSV